MKKTLTFLLACLLTLTACSNKNEPVVDKAIDQNQTTKEETPTNQPGQDNHAPDQGSVADNTKQSNGQSHINTLEAQSILNAFGNEVKLLNQALDQNFNPESDLATNENRDKLKLLAQSKLGDQLGIDDLLDDDLYFLLLIPKEKLKDGIGALILYDQDKALKDSWKNTGQALADLSKTYFSSTKDPLVIMIVNPLNAENILFSSINGEITYDFVNNL